MKLIATFVFLTMSVFRISPNSADDIVGIWWTEGKKAKVRVYEKEGRYSGEIIWLKSVPGTEHVIRDSKNIIDSLKQRPLLGIDLIEGLTFKDSKWVEGKVYDPEKGKSYDCVLKLEGDQLEVRGYINRPIFGKSVFWKRVEETE